MNADLTKTTLRWIIAVLFMCRWTRFSYDQNYLGGRLDWKIGRLKATFKSFGYVQLGVYEFNPSYRQTRNGLNLAGPGGATGVLVPFEIGWPPVLGGGLAGS